MRVYLKLSWLLKLVEILGDSVLFRSGSVSVKRGESPLTPSLEHTRRKWDKHVYASDIPDYFEAPQASTTTQKNKK